MLIMDSGIYVLPKSIIKKMSHEKVINEVFCWVDNPGNDSQLENLVFVFCIEFIDLSSKKIKVQIEDGRLKNIGSFKKILKSKVERDDYWGPCIALVIKLIDEKITGRPKVNYLKLRKYIRMLGVEIKGGPGFNPWLYEEKAQFEDVVNQFYKANKSLEENNKNFLKRQKLWKILKDFPQIELEARTIIYKKKPLLFKKPKSLRKNNDRFLLIVKILENLREKLIKTLVSPELTKDEAIKLFKVKYSGAFNLKESIKCPDKQESKLFEFTKKGLKLRDFKV